METLYDAYKGRGVRFLYVKSREVSPSAYGYPEAKSLQERLEEVRLVKRELGTRIPWIIDSMDNAAQRLYGGLPNAEFIIGADGKLIAKRPSADPQALRDELAKLVGPASLPADVWQPAAAGAQPGNPDWLPRRYLDEIPPAQKPPASRLIPLSVKTPKTLAIGGKRIQVALSAQLFVERLGDREGGRLYLTLKLPPGQNLYWNNLGGPQVLALTPRAGVQFVKQELQSGARKAESDPLDRVFVVNWRQPPKAGRRVDFGVALKSLICDEKAGWCAPCEPTFTISGTLPASRT